MVSLIHLQSTMRTILIRLDCGRERSQVSGTFATTTTSRTEQTSRSKSLSVIMSQRARMPRQTMMLAMSNPLAQRLLTAVRLLMVVRLSESISTMTATVVSKSKSTRVGDTISMAAVTAVSTRIVRAVNGKVMVLPSTVVGMVQHHQPRLRATGPVSLRGGWNIHLRVTGEVHLTMD